jgi:hypothetical protein
MMSSVTGKIRRAIKGLSATEKKYMRNADGSKSNL